jgi:enoyl-CoA hydratase/carnithine racemase
LLLDIVDKVATVTITRPDKGNALAPGVLEEITTVFTGLGGRQDVNVIILTGGERYFRSTARR